MSKPNHTAMPTAARPEMAQVQTSARSQNAQRPPCPATRVHDARRSLNTALWIFPTPPAWPPSRDRPARQRTPAPRKFRPIATKRHFTRNIVEPPHTPSHDRRTRQSNRAPTRRNMHLTPRGNSHCGGGYCLTCVLLIAKGERPTRIWRFRLSGPATDQTKGARRREQQHGQSKPSRGCLHFQLPLLRRMTTDLSGSRRSKRPRPVERKGTALHHKQIIV
jgi:hypothetical protein